MSEYKIKVLVVDDEEGLLELTQKLIRFKCGYETIGTMDGEEAVKLFTQQRPDICIIEVFLPLSKLEGLDVLREILMIDHKVKCIMTTRTPDEASKIRSRMTGALAYLIKPHDTKEWLELVKKVGDGILKERTL